MRAFVLWFFRPLLWLPVVLAALWAWEAFAQGNTGQSTTGISRGNGLRIPEYRTAGTGAQSYFVDGALGNDSNTCTSSGASACLTHQGALNKVPKLLRDLVTITTADGNYPCFRISGFTYDNGVQNNNAGLYITGNLATASVATGTASGTSTAGSVGADTTYGTLTDAAQTWTVNDLRGKLATIGASKFVISSNTATTITVVGTCSACAAAVTYTIQVPGWNVNTACGSSPTPLNAAGANSCMVCTTDNAMSSRSAGPAIVIENVGFTAGAGNGLLIGDASSYRLNQFMRTSTGAASTVSFLSGATSSFVHLSIGSSTGSTSAYAVSGGYNVQIGNTISYGSNAGLVNFGGLNSPGMPVLRIASSESTNSTTAGILLSSGRMDFQNSRLNCAGGAGVGLSVGNSTTTSTLSSLSYPVAAAALQSAVLGPTCGTAVFAYGPVWVMLNQGTFTGATTGVLTNFGALVAETPGGIGVTVTGGTNAISWDNGAVTAATADVSTGSCITTPTYSSRYCK